MNKQNILICLLLTMLLACQQSKRDNFTMEMPETKPAILAIKAGIPQELADEKIVFEKHVRISWNVVVDRLYANGAYYRIYRYSSQSLKDDNVAWEKLGVMSQKGVKKIEKISNTSVVDFIMAGPDPNHMSDYATKNIQWYFYFDQPKFAKTQVKTPQWKWWVQPRFVKQMAETIREF